MIFRSHKFQNTIIVVLSLATFSTFAFYHISTNAKMNNEAFVQEKLPIKNLTSIKTNTVDNKLKEKSPTDNNNLSTEPKAEDESPVISEDTSSEIIEDSSSDLDYYVPESDSDSGYEDESNPIDVIPGDTTTDVTPSQPPVVTPEEPVDPDPSVPEPEVPEPLPTDPVDPGPSEPVPEEPQPTEPEPEPEQPLPETPAQ